MKTKIIQLLSASLLASTVILSTSYAQANKELVDTVSSTGLSGSFLAAQVAIDDNDEMMQ